MASKKKKTKVVVSKKGFRNGKGKVKSKGIIRAKKTKTPRKKKASKTKGGKRRTKRVITRKIKVHKTHRKPVKVSKKSGKRRTPKNEIRKGSAKRKTRVTTTKKKVVKRKGLVKHVTSRRVKIKDKRKDSKISAVRSYPKKSRGKLAKKSAKTKVKRKTHKEREQELQEKIRVLEERLAKSVEVIEEPEVVAGPPPPLEVYSDIELPPVYRVQAGDAGGYTEHLEGAAEAFMASSHGNIAPPDLVIKDVFERAFIHNLKKGPFEADEVNIYRYGILIRPREGIATKELVEKIQRMLSVYPGASMHVVTEGKTFSIRLNIGNPYKGRLAGVVSDDLRNHADMLGEIFSVMENAFGATSWWAFWETEEAMYE